MRKKITMLGFAVMSISVALAQRDIDLSVRLVRPAMGNSITSGDSLPVVLNIENLGTSTLSATDTIIFGFYLEGDPNKPLKTLDGRSVLAVFTGTEVPVNTSGDIEFNFDPIYHELTGSKEFCVVAKAFSGSTDSIIDDNIANNLNCMSVQYISSPTSLREINGAKSGGIVSGFYPNPAYGIVNFDLKMEKPGKVDILITDITGKAVINERKGTLLNGEHTIKVVTSQLPEGIYYYDIKIGDERARGKFAISR